MGHALDPGRTPYGWAVQQREACGCSTCTCLACNNTLSLSGACQEDVVASTSVRHAGLSQARRLADARPKLSGRNSSSTVLSQVCLGLPVLRRQSLGGPRMQAWLPSPKFSNFFNNGLELCTVRRLRPTAKMSDSHRHFKLFKSV